MLDERGFHPPVIVDHATITHTRPVGSAGNGGSSAPMVELQRFLRMKNLTIEKPINWAGILKDGTCLSMTSELERFQIQLIKDLSSKAHMDFIKLSQEMMYIANTYGPPVQDSSISPSYASPSLNQRMAA
jgi:hypothetical protein